MNCKKCGTEMMIDSIVDDVEVYTCINPQCINYRRITIPKDGMASIENKQSLTKGE